MSPAECAQFEAEFEAEFAEALARAGAECGRAQAEAVLDRLDRADLQADLDDAHRAKFRARAGLAVENWIDDA